MEKKRLHSIDTLRGITMVSMILYHFCWDLKYISGYGMKWYDTPGGYLWQQSICMTFILIAGFCFHLTGNPIKNGLLVSACGIIVTLVTVFAMPDAPVFFGILTMTGSSILLTGLVKKAADGSPAHPGAWLAICAALFFITRHINSRVLQLFFTDILLPEGWYQGGGSDGMENPLLTYLGITQNGFQSSDYFSMLPWFFLFMTGCFLYYPAKNWFNNRMFEIRLPFFTWFGRHSLLVYMLHQPILYVIVSLMPKP